MKKVWLLLLIGILLCSHFVGCSPAVQEQNSISANETDSKQDGQNAPPKDTVQTVYQIAYQNIEYISNDGKALWRDALIRLISNEGKDAYDDEGWDGYEYPFPDRPGIPRSRHIGLFDINIDGTPELLVNIGGGSAGNASYWVFDIFSGEYLGHLDGGFSDEWCIYLNTSTGKYESIGQFQWRNGADGQLRFVNKATIIDVTESQDDPVYEQPYLYASYSFDPLKDAFDETGSDTTVTFKMNGESVSMETYFAEYDSFVKNYVRISETGLKLIKRSDYTSSEEIVDALLASDQKFIRAENP